MDGIHRKNRSYDEELCALHDELVTFDVRLKRPASACARAVQVRNVVANNVVRGGTSGLENFSWREPLESWRASRDASLGGLKCGGITFMYMHALKAFGIASRPVVMVDNFDAKVGPINTHIATGVLTENGWVAMDPTFNISLRSAKGPLSWQAAREALLKGEPVYADDDGARVAVDWHVALEQPGLDQLMRYMLVGRSKTADGRPLRSQVLGDWSGVLIQANGELFDFRSVLTTPDSVFRRIARGASPRDKRRPPKNREDEIIGASHNFQIGAGRRELERGMLHAYVRELGDLRLELEKREPRLRRAASQAERAVLLRSLIARTIPRGDTRDSDHFPWKRPLDSFLRALDPHSGGLRCAGLTFLFLHALKAYGIPGRPIAIAASTEPRDGVIDTHMSAEVRLDGHWAAMDPTFNVSFKRDGANLSWRETRRLLLRGERLLASDDGEHTPTDRHLGAQQPRLEEIVRYMVLAPTRSRKDPRPARALGDWDGVLEFPGSKFSFLNSMNARYSVYWLFAASKAPAPPFESDKPVLRPETVFEVGEGAPVRDALLKNYARDIAALRKTLEKLEPKLVNAKALQRTILLREMLHARVERKPNSALCDYPWSNPLEAFRLASDPVQGGHDSTGFMIIYMHMLKAFGIDSRTVAFAPHADAAEGPNDYHCAVDARIGDQWVAMDPYNNCAFEAAGRLVRWKRVRRLAKRKPKVRAVTAPGSTRAFPFVSKTLRYMHLGQIRGEDGTLGGDLGLQGWDGVFRYASGATLDFGAAMANKKNCYPLILEASGPTN